LSSSTSPQSPQRIARIQIIETFGHFLSQSVDKKLLVLYGGAGSGKSHAVAQWLILKALQERNKHFLIVRKTLPSLRLSCWLLVESLLREYALPFEANKSEFTIAFRGNTFFFKPLDDPEKIKSVNVNYIWAEEATELSYEDFLQLKLRLRRKNEFRNQIYLTFNPVDANHWLKTKLVDAPSPEMAALVTTYRNNPFLPEDYVRDLERLSEQDENYYRIYALGEWGVLQNLIYTNWDIAEALPEMYDLQVFGLDFGYNNPTALIEVRMRENEAWIHEVLYRSHMTNQDLVGFMRDVVSRSAQIFADSSEPQRIEEIYRAGFDVHPANKDVRAGIDKVKRYRLHITADSVNLLKEIRSYGWRQDKEGKILEEPVKFNDHAMDALRYALASLKHPGAGVGIRSVL